MSTYNELIKGRVFIGGANDVKDVAKDKDIDTVIDWWTAEEILKEESDSTIIHNPILDNTELQDDSVKKAVVSVVDAYNEGKNVFVHCAAGRNRTGTVAIGTLLELDFAKNAEDADAKAKSIRAEIEIKPEMKETIKNLYTNNDEWPIDCRHLYNN